MGKYEKLKFCLENLMECIQSNKKSALINEDSLEMLLSRTLTKKLIYEKRMNKNKTVFWKAKKDLTKDEQKQREIEKQLWRDVHNEKQKSKNVARLVSKRVTHFQYKNQPHGFCLSRKEWIMLWRADKDAALPSKDWEEIFDRHLFEQDYNVIKHKNGICHTFKD